MTHVNTRLLDADEERLNTLTPLRGYAEEPLVSLEKAVVKLRTLVDDVDARVWTAMNRCEKPADELSPAESAAIVLYTIEWDPSHPSLYLVLNRTLRLEDRRKLTPWFPYLKLLLTALFKLPSICCTIWRGVRGDLRAQYKLGGKITWWAFSSCTTTISVLESDQYLGTSGPRTLFAIECLNGKDIKRHSYFAQEEEILLLPCTHFQVISHLRSMENLYIIHLREIQPPFMLLELPDPMSAGSGIKKPSYAQLQSKLEQLTNENERLKVRCNELETENEILNKSYADYENEIQRLKQDNRRMKQEGQHSAQEIASQKEETQRCKQDVRHLKQEAQQSDAVIERLNTEIQRFKQEIERLKHSSATSSERTTRTSLVSSERTIGE
ncbi:unnamed protein product [Rotaria sordida]|uniref:NAD(P)(+)--arginine ADP-ribosyltransferase n=1 Tax=Rotaria sordida TaxID=392033 RepID=A0A814HIE2_9BILA|nr:unnamed protein product [Rotaria sordida]CAF1535806.1 unnamed protein product [Rotaria sordida]